MLLDVSSNEEVGRKILPKFLYVLLTTKKNAKKMFILILCTE